ncbi:tyrosine-type recombinase/integrase [uncultured Treponema sp.]|uniref:tyrosine-type recombinase/integrase n=1 Tax=uncultured Treponema sp. TaxID=162155 RepID=UPI0015A82563|nr:tyrosine-type recombinase/integrase [uncultured Treponema sp.]
MKIEVKKINGELALKVPYDEDLIAKLMYGTGMRVSEAIGLRIQDIDFGQNEIIIKRGKGDKDRCTMLPGALKTEIKDQMEKVKKIHEQDLKDGFGGGSETAGFNSEKISDRCKRFPLDGMF